MSLINDVLRDLAQRPGVAAAAPVLEAVSAPRRARPSLGSLRFVLAAAALASATSLTHRYFHGRIIHLTPAPATAERNWDLPGLRIETRLHAAGSRLPLGRTPLWPVELALATVMKLPAALATPVRAVQRVAAPVVAMAPSPARIPAAEAVPAAAPPEDTAELMRRALQAQAAGDLATAETLYRQVLARDAGVNEAREALAALLLAARRFDDAQTVIDAGHAREPGWNAYPKLAARLALARGQAQDALADLRAQPVPALASDPEYFALLAASYQRLGHHDEAADLYGQLAESQPMQAQWYVAGAISLEALGQKQRALTAYTRARQIGRLEPALLEFAAARSSALRAELKD